MVQDTRTLNRNAVLTELLRSRPISRKQIATNTGISSATVSRTVDALIAEGVLQEGDELVVESRGRRAVSLDLVAHQFHVLGIDLGASITRLIVTDLVANPIVAAEVATPAELEPQELAQWLAQEVRSLYSDAWPAVTELSLGLPGAVSQHDTTVSNAPNLPQVENPLFLRAVESEFGLTPHVDNDANFALLGEQRFGAARNTPMAGMLTLGAGLGAALSINGHILRGRHGLVGEFGQLPVGPLGTRLEHLVTGPGILRRASELGVHLADPSELFVESPSPTIQQLRNHFDQALLIVLTAIAVSSEPEVIVLGGGISKSLESSLPRYREALRQNLRVSPTLIPAALGDFSGAVGAAVASLHAVYEKLGVEERALGELPAGEAMSLERISQARRGASDASSKTAQVAYARI